MTALKKYQRLEATGLWRPAPDEQRREVIVSIGDATLVIADLKDQPLAHWSLAAVERQNPGVRPAIYSPDGDPGETLELSGEEDQMIRAIEKLRSAIDRARPHPGRLRWVSVAVSALAVVALAVFWLPGAMRRHAAEVVPQITRVAIGEALLARIERLSGPACNSRAARPALQRLSERMGVRRIVVLPAGVAQSLALPGGLVLLNRSLIEDHDSPEVAAGYVIEERARRQSTDPLTAILNEGGVRASFQLITTGALPLDLLDAHAERIVVDPRPEVAEDGLLAAFAGAQVASTPYAYARDITGESVLGLIEGDPMTGKTPAPVLPDRDWVLLQSICEG